MSKFLYFRHLALLLVLFGGFVAKANAQEIDDLQDYLDQLAAEQPVQARQRVIQKDGEIEIPVGLTEVDLSKFTSYQNRKKELSINTSVKFINGTIAASSDFAGGTSLLKIYGGATVVIDETSGVDASAASAANCIQAVGIYEGSTLYQNGDIIAAGREDGVAVYLSSADDSYYYVSGKVIGSIENPNNGKVEGIEDLSGYVKKLQARMTAFSTEVNSLQTRVVNIKLRLEELTTGTEFFMRKSSSDFESSKTAFIAHVAVNQKYIEDIINEFNGLLNKPFSTMSEAEAIDKSLTELEERLPTADNDLTTTESGLEDLVRKYEALDVNFPTKDQAYNLVPNTGVSRNDIQMGYKSNRGYVLTSAGMMFFEQVSGADLRIYDQNGDYVKLVDNSAFLTGGSQAEAAIWTGYNLGNGIYRFYNKSTKQYLTCSGNKVNSEIMLGSNMEWKVTESDLDDLQAFLNMLAEEEEESGQSGSSGSTTEQDTLKMVIPVIQCLGCNKTPWIFPKVPYVIRVEPRPGCRLWDIPNPNPGVRRPDDFHPIHIKPGSHVVIDDIDIIDNIGGGHVIYVEGVLEINVKVIINIMNWDWFIHVGPSGKVIWHPGKGDDPSWIPPRVKIDKGGDVELGDGGYIGYIDNTGSFTQSGGTVEHVVNRTSYSFTGGIINFMDNYGVQTHSGGVVWKVNNRAGSTYTMTGGEIINNTENTTDTVFVNLGNFYFKGGTIGGYGSRLIYHGPGAGMWLDGGKFDFTHITNYFIEAHNVFYIRGDYDIPLPFLLNPSVSVRVMYKWIYKWKMQFIGGIPKHHYPLFYGDGNFKLIRDYITYIDYTLPNYRWRWYFNESENSIEPRNEDVEDEDDLQAYLDWLAEHQDGDAASSEEKPQELDLGGREIVLTRQIDIPVNTHVYFRNCTFRPKGPWADERVFVVPSGSTVRYEKVIIDFSSSNYYYIGGQYVQRYIFDIKGNVYFGEGCQVKGYVNTTITPTDNYIPGAVFKVDPELGHVYFNGGLFENIVFYVTNIVNIYVSVNLTGNVFFYLPTELRSVGLRIMSPYNGYKFITQDVKYIHILGLPDWRAEIDIDGFLSLYDFIERYDVNRDKSVNVEDVVEIARSIMNMQKSEFFNAKAADVNGDGKINVADIVMLVNLILSGY